MGEESSQTPTLAHSLRVIQQAMSHRLKSLGIIKNGPTLSTQLLCRGFLSLVDNCDDFIGCKMPFSSFRCSASLLLLSFGDLAQSEKTIYSQKPAIKIYNWSFKLQDKNRTISNVQSFQQFHVILK